MAKDVGKFNDLIRQRWLDRHALLASRKLMEETCRQLYEERAEVPSGKGDIRNMRRRLELSKKARNVRSQHFLNAMEYKNKYGDDE